MSSNSGLPSGYTPGSFWYYDPNLPAPIVFAVLFGASCLWHFWQCHRFRSWKGTGMLPWAGVLFTVGFIMRAIGHFKYDSLVVYIVSQVFLLCSPPIYEAANFFTLGRILYYVPYHAPLHPGRVVTTFGFIQLIVESLNGSGAARAANPAFTARQQNVGKILIKIALFLQLFSMACFVYLAWAFEYRCRKAGLLPQNLRTILKVLYASCTLITIRTIYRTVEYFQDETIVYNQPSTFPSIFTREWYFWVFEAMLMVTNTWLLNICHPGRYLPANLKIYLAPDGVNEIEGQGFEDKRPFWLTLVDPLDIGGMIKGRGQKDVWEEQAREEAAAHGVELGAMQRTDTRKTESTTPLRR